jgi:hypothetical protein
MTPVAFGLFDWIDRGTAPLHQLYEERLQLLEAADAAGSSRATWCTASRTSATRRRACSTGACRVDRTTTSQRSPNSPPATASPASR